MKKPFVPSFRNKDVVAIARCAGDAIMHELANTATLGVQQKTDDSPVTSADRRANEIVLAGLKELTPDIPILSEEDTPEHQQWVMQQEIYWCVDPLDGTRTAVKYSEGNTQYDGFGTLIGLVHRGVPVFGVAHYPNNPSRDDASRGVTYFTSTNGTIAYRQHGDEAPEPIQAKPCFQHPLQVAEGWGGDRLANLCGQPVLGSKEVGGSRIIRAAEGAVHTGYMGGSKAESFGFWDVAGPHAILRAAGGEIMTIPGDFAQHQQAGALQNAEPLRYDGRHYAAGIGAGKPYVPLSVGAHKETLRMLGAPDREASITR